MVNFNDTIFNAAKRRGYIDTFAIQHTQEWEMTFIGQYVIKYTNRLKDLQYLATAWGYDNDVRVRFGGCRTGNAVGKRIYHGSGDGLSATYKNGYACCRKSVAELFDISEQYAHTGSDNAYDNAGYGIFRTYGTERRKFQGVDGNGRGQCLCGCCR